MWNKLELDSQKIINDFTKNKFSICDFNFANLYLWSLAEDTEYKIEDDILLIKSSYNDKEYYYMPVPKYENENSLNIMKEKIKKITEKKIPILYFSEYWYEKLKDEFSFTEIRASSDYIYLYEDLAYLKGRKYSKKRNQINQFLKKYNYTYEKISKENINAVIEFQKEWAIKMNLDNEKILKNEAKGILSLLSNYFSLNLKGGLLKVEDKIIAYTIGEETKENTAVIYVEKALTEYTGSYQVINMEFLQKEYSECKYVNREDDFGDEGLRKAKLSYHPLNLLKKYSIMEV